MEKLEGIIGSLIRYLARERKDRTKQPIAASNVHMASAGSVFSQFLAAKNGRARADSVEEAIGIAPANPAPPFMATPQQNRAPEQFFPPMQEPAAGREFRPPQNYGYKIASVKDMKLQINRFTGKEEYSGLGSKFKE